MKINPYLTFDGQGAAALAFYAKVFDSKIVSSMRFGDMPDADQMGWVTDANRDRIANAVLDLAGTPLMISDTAGHEPFAGHSGSAINVSFDTLEEGEAAFAALTDGGEVSMPFAETFWAKGFGNGKDKFGVSWMVNVY